MFTIHVAMGLHWVPKCSCCQQDRDWLLLLLGSGIHGEGGALLLYRSPALSSGQHICIAPSVLGSVR
jgi:hypothetical protein